MFQQKTFHSSQVLFESFEKNYQYDQFDKTEVNDIIIQTYKENYAKIP